MSSEREAIAVRMAVETDLPVILDFIERLADYERLADKCFATEDKLRATLFTQSPAAEVLIASIDKRPVGFALFFHNYSTFLAQRGVFLEDLFVAPEARGKGVGGALLSSLARIALDRDCGRIEWNVLDWNELAIGFYRSIGAVVMDDWTTFRITDTPLITLAAKAPHLTQ
ncbi:MAG: GNAT family N-acetyltransferase [Gemmatimonadota bacterium]|nr:GNAT family N-acetyltransferase [Gemmatimonadota bacterium]